MRSIMFSSQTIIFCSGMQIDGGAKEAQNKVYSEEKGEAGQQRALESPILDISLAMFWIVGRGGVVPS